MRFRALLRLLVVLATARRSLGWREEASSTLEVLQRLTGGHGEAVLVQQDKPRPGESPIYYLRLPPSPCYYADDAASASVPLPSHHKVDINFTINGRPGKVYHWSSPSTSHNHHHQSQPAQPSASSPPSTSLPPLLSTTIVPLSGTPSAGPSPATKGQATPRPTLPEKPYIRSRVVLKKKFSFNGKPTKVYVWRNGSPLTVKNHRRASQPFRF